MAVYVSGIIMQEMLINDSWLKVSYHFVIYFYLNTIMTALTRAKIVKIKYQGNYQINIRFIKLRKKRKGRTKYYFKNHKRQGVGNIKSKKHKISREDKVTSLNTILYKSSINKSNQEEYWEKESYPIAIDSYCSVSIAKYKQDFVGP